MLDPRSFRTAGIAVATLVAAGLAANGCKSSEKAPAKPAPTVAKAEADGAPAKPAPARSEGRSPSVAGARGEEFPPRPPVITPESPTPAAPPEKEVPVSEAMKAAPDPVRPPDEPYTAPVVQTPSQAAASKDEALLKALAEEKRLEVEKRKFLAGQFTANGDKAYQALKFDEAKEWAMRALDQDSAHQPALDLLLKSRTALGERVADVQDLAREISEMQRVKADMARERVRALYEKGRAEMAAKNYDGAYQAFDSAWAGIQAAPYGVTWGDLQSGVEKGRSEAALARDRAAEGERRKAAEDAYRMVKADELARQRAQDEKFRTLMAEAYAAYDREDYGTAESLAAQALDMEPTSGRAQGLKESSARARHGQTTEATRMKEKEQFRRWKLDMQETAIPYSGLLDGPDRAHWEKITRLRKDLGQVTGGVVESSPEASALKNRLAQETTSFKFDGQPLSAAVNYLSARHGINIYVDEAVKADVDAQPLPSFGLSGVSLKDALDLLLTYVPGHVYRVRGNVVLITKPELARDPPIIRVHPVGDLTMKINNFVAPNLILKPSGAEADENNPLFGKTEEGAQMWAGAEDLANLIKDNVGDSAEVWNAEASIEAHGEANLLVVAEPGLQDSVARFLADLRKFSGLVVNIESRFLTVTDNFLKDITVDITGLGGNKGTNATLDDVTNGLDDFASLGFDNGGVGIPANASGHPAAGAFFNDNSDGDYRGRTEHIFDKGLSSALTSIGGAILQWTLLDDTQLSMIFYAVEKKQEARILQSPNLTVFNTQRANITLINQLAFVQDFDVEVAQTAFIADPQIAIIQDGLALDVRPVVSNDRRYVTLQLQPTIATLTRPIQTFTTSLGAFTSPVTLQLPEINIQKAQTTVRVPNGGTLLIGGLKNIGIVDLKSETPLLSKIPIVSFFFSRRGSGQDFSNLLIVIRARIVDLGEEEMAWGSPR